MRFFDEDLYKLTMQQAINVQFPQARAKYRFKNRGNHRFNRKFLTLLREEIEYIAYKNSSSRDLEKLSKLPFINPWYVKYLSNYEFNPSEVGVGLTYDNDLNLLIDGPWSSAVLWEVRLMATISELYFKTIDTNWSMQEHIDKIAKKGERLSKAGCKFADFGTRRRRAFDVQNITVSELSKFDGFLGTSNVHLAFKYGVKPIGTMAHEWVQANAALVSINHANEFMMNNWTKVYGSQLGIALSDTYGVDNFLRDFSLHNSKLFDGTRHDSGDPFKYTKKIVDHYTRLGINPNHKEIVFSDSLNVDKAIALNDHCDRLGINCSFGIGTHFTNDFENYPALNMVIKLWSIDGVPTVKLSDESGKANGDEEYVKMYRFLYRMS